MLSVSLDRKSTRLNSSHTIISYAVFCLKKKKNETMERRAAGHAESGGGRGTSKWTPAALTHHIAPCAPVPSSYLPLFIVFFFFLMIRRPPRSTLFPYPPLFR